MVFLTFRVVFRQPNITTTTINIGRFERLDCLVEMGEWAMGRGLAQSGMDYLRSALDLLYDVEVGRRLSERIFSALVWSGF